jgi:putative nucleotidyltransferase with HDIG domain
MPPESLARRIARVLRSHQFEALFVGGCVRDLLLHRRPKDWDIATDATPDQMLKLFPGANLVGAQFGVVLVRDEDAQVEVATFRSDGVYEDGRRPVNVRFETRPSEDAARRDFTINALFLDPENDRILDFVGGLDDISAQIIRAIGDPEARFQEDRLRLLRAIRFAARLGFRIEPSTFHGIREELTRILTEGAASRGFELLDASGLLEQVLPEISAMKGVEQPPEFHPEGDVWVHTLLLLEKLNNPTPTLAWGALLHDVGKPPTFQRGPDRIRFNGHAEEGVGIARHVLSRLRFSREDSEQVLALIANHMKFIDALDMRESTLKRFVRQPAFEEHLELHRIDCLSSNGYTDTYNYVKGRVAELSEDALKPTPLITGRDLIALGYEPGPIFSEILEAVEDGQLEGSLKSAEEAIGLVEERYPRPGVQRL